VVSIRHEEPGDSAAIRAVNEKAFGQSDEAEIVDKLRAAGNSVLSLVAIRDREIVGHIQFSPVTMEHEGSKVEGVGLGPMAVLPEFQGQAIGSALVEAGISDLRDRAYSFVVVLGHPEYYPRFGFRPASEQGIASQWKDVSDEAFMALILRDAEMNNVLGVATYGLEFG
jgi:putative acetyltransferase